MVYAPHLLRWSVFVPSASPEQVHGALSHTVNDRSWYWSSPTLVYEPTKQVLDQRSLSIGDFQRRIFLTYAMTPQGTIVNAKQRALGEMAITSRVILMSFLVLGTWALI